MIIRVVVFGAYCRFVQVYECLYVYVSVWVCGFVGLSVCDCVFVCCVDVFMCECHCLCDLEGGDQTSNRLGIEMNATDVWVCVSECVFNV